MPCMCGDPYCGSCGPAQGNYRCMHCGRWTLDGGCINPEACANAEDAYWEEQARLEMEASKREEENGN
jgi:hypothetical protein